MGVAPRAGSPILTGRAARVKEAVAGGEQVVGPATKLEPLPFAPVAARSEGASRRRAGLVNNRGRG